MRCSSSSAQIIVSSGFLLLSSSLACANEELTAAIGDLLTSVAPPISTPGLSTSINKSESDKFLEEKIIRYLLLLGRFTQSKENW
jgi:hypothetical protein